MLQSFLKCFTALTLSLTLTPMSINAGILGGASKDDYFVIDDSQGEGVQVEQNACAFPLSLDAGQAS